MRKGEEETTGRQQGDNWETTGRQQEQDYNAFDLIKNEEEKSIAYCDRDLGEEITMRGAGGDGAWIHTQKRSRCWTA